MTTPVRMIQTLHPIAATSMRYWNNAAIGDFTAMTEQAKPTIRTPKTARIEAVIEKLRLCRVVLGVPRNAKVRAANANG